MAVKNGDMVRVDYEAYLVDEDVLFDTSKEDKAQEAGIFDEKYKYAPMPVMVGGGKVFPGFEQAIEGAEVGEEKEATIPPELAAGERDPKLTELFPLREFQKKDINPYPGLEVSIGNRRGTVASVSAGRVRVDFNNPLAGKTLRYKFTVTELIEDPEEKAKAILDLNFGTSEGFEFDVKEDSVEITLAEVCKFDQSWPMARFALVSDLRETLGVDTVRFIEVWSKVSKDDEPVEAEAVPEEEPAAEE